MISFIQKPLLFFSRSTQEVVSIFKLIHLVFASDVSVYNIPKTLNNITVVKK